MSNQLEESKSMEPQLIQSVVGSNPQPLPRPSSTDLPVDGTSVIFVLLFALSEVLPFLGGRFKKYNGIFQTVNALIRNIKPLRSEDEAVAELREEIEDLKNLVSKKDRSLLHNIFNRSGK